VSKLFSSFARQSVASSRVAVCGTGAHLRYLDVHLVFDLVVQHLGRRGGSGRHRRRRHRLTQLVRLRAGAAARGEPAPQVGSPLLEGVGERAQQRTLLAILALRGRPGSTSPRALVSSKGSATLNSNISLGYLPATTYRTACTFEQCEPHTGLPLRTILLCVRKSTHETQVASEL
jgi:hypothetical protein